ncbi:MAG: response regulator, partial [Candidatus Krumholzibacteriia bacterium]
IDGEKGGEILIVEDDGDFVEDLFTMWSPPLPVARASSGREAVEYLRTSAPTLVLLDLNLPHYLADDDDGEGLGILSFIKSRPGTEIPVIIITRESSNETRLQAEALGAQGFFPKPLQISDLEDAVSRIVRAA